MNQSDFRLGFPAIALWVADEHPAKPIHRRPVRQAESETEKVRRLALDVPPVIKDDAASLINFKLHDFGARTDSSHHISSEMPEDGWIEWNGGERPIPDGVQVIVRLWNGSEYKYNTTHSSLWRWTKNAHYTASNIVAYKLVKEQPKPAADGWIEWNGGECPIDENMSCTAKLRDGTEYRCYKAGNLEWRASGSRYDIVAYKLN